MSPRKLEARQCAELLSLAERDGANAFADRWYQSVDLFQSAFAANEPRADVSVSRAFTHPPFRTHQQVCQAQRGGRLCMAYREVRAMDIEQVIRRWTEGEGIRAIARATGLDRNTVRRLIRLAEKTELKVGNTATE